MGKFNGLIAGILIGVTFSNPQSLRMVKHALAKGTSIIIDSVGLKEETQQEDIVQDNSTEIFPSEDLILEA